MKWKAGWLLVAAAASSITPVALAWLELAIRRPPDWDNSIAYVVPFGLIICGAVSVIVLVPLGIICKNYNARRISIFVAAGAATWLTMSVLYSFRIIRFHHDNEGPERAREVAGDLLIAMAKFSTYGIVGAIVFFSVMHLSQKKICRESADFTPSANDGG